MLSGAAKRSRVFVTRLIPDAAISLLKSRFEVVQWESDLPIPREKFLQTLGDGFDGLFCILTERIDAEALDRACSNGNRLKIVSTMSVGYDHIDVAECRRRQVRIGNTPCVLTEATAELTVALALCTARRLIEGVVSEVRGGRWATWAPLYMCGKGLQDSTVGIIGLGRIGMSVAEKLQAFKPATILYSGSTEKQQGVTIAEFVPLDDLLTRSDFVFVTCALNEQTRGLINASALKRMKNDAILINTSRGPIVDQQALYDALSTGEIGAAGLDVCYPEPISPDDPLLTLDNLVLLPHIGSATVKSRTDMAVLAANNIVAALERKPMPAEVIE